MINSLTFGKRNLATIERRKKSKDGLQLAERVLRDTQNYYGRPKSSTYLVSKIIYHKNNPKYKDVAQKVYNKALEYEEIIYHSGIKTVDRVLLSQPKEPFYYGNCGHCAKAIQHELWFKYKVPSVNVVMEAKTSNSKFCNHAFNVSNIQKGMDITKPHTWGKETVVTDLWSGIALKSDDAINHFYRLFNINPFEDNVTFKTMPDFSNSLQRLFLKENNIEYQGYSN